MNLGEVLDKLYDSKINRELASFWDTGWKVRLGDEMNGYVAGTVVKTAAEAALWLDEQARMRYPRSKFAMGIEPPGEFVNGNP